MPPSREDLVLLALEVAAREPDAEARAEAIDRAAAGDDGEAPRQEEDTNG